MRRLLPLVAALAACAVTAGATAAYAADDLLYAGSYTSKASKGIYAWRFDPRSGALQPLGLAAETEQPAHVWIAPNGKTLYAVNWLADGAVSAFRIDHRTGRLTLLNRVSARGSLPNQVVVDPTGHLAVTVNYNTGNVVVYRIRPDGSLSDSVYVDQHTGAPLSPAQPGPKAHGIEFTKDGRYMFIAQLGLDRVYSYRVDPARARITPLDPPYVNTHAGAGPRRMQLSPDDRFLYVDHETDSEVSVFAVHDGQLTEIQTISTRPPGYTGRNTTAELVIDRAGRRLYVGNRGADTIAVFDIDRATGKLTAAGQTPSGGRTPRNLRLDPTGRYLFAANENGGNIVEFAVDPKTGALTPTGVTAQIDTPGGIAFTTAQ